jgi:hypothetical protein
VSMDDWCPIFLIKMVGSFFKVNVFRHIFFCRFSNFEDKTTASSRNIGH